MRRQLLAIALPTLFAIIPACAVDEDPVVEQADTRSTIGSALSSIDSLIQKVYRDTLDRDAAEPEVALWSSKLQTGGWSLAAMRSAFCDSAEATRAIAAIYDAVLKRAPQASETDLWRKYLKLRGWTIARIRAAIIAGLIDKLPQPDPQPQPEPSPCNEWVATWEFASPFGTGNIVIGDPLGFQITVMRSGGPSGLSSMPATLDGQPINVRFFGPGVRSTDYYLGVPYQLVTAQTPRIHTLSIPTPCGDAGKSVQLTPILPIVPQAAIQVSSTYVDSGAAVTLFPTVTKFTPETCQSVIHTVIGREAGTDQVVFERDDVSQPIVVHPTADTYYSSTTRCRNSAPQPGTPTMTTSPATLVSVYTAPSTPDGGWYCFKIENANLGTCFVEALQAASEDDAEALETSWNPSATVESLGECTYLPDACDQ
jgi:hypothetical protein